MSQLHGNVVLEYSASKFLHSYCCSTACTCRQRQHQIIKRYVY